MNSTSLKPVFAAMDPDDSGAITKQQIMDCLDRSGIEKTDPRVEKMIKALDESGSSASIDQKQFTQIAANNVSLLDRIIKDDLAIPEFDKFAGIIQRIFDQTRKNTSGDVGSYIPQLARVAPDQFGVSICTIDGQRLVMGDANVDYSFQSTCKPILYCAALEEHDVRKVHQHVGREPSGVSFNALTLNTRNLPHNPMINAGAIMSTSLIKRELPTSDRFEHVVDLIQQLSGGQRPTFDNAVFHSERDTADRNFALAHYMREVGAFPENTDINKTLELYFAYCSVQVNADQMASIAATFANGGACPRTGNQVLNDDTVKNCLSMMYSCGMYDYSGEFAFRIGIPAKSGVCGGVWAVIPNVMGIAIWSPRLDENGNSVRGVEFMKRLTNEFNFHNYDSLVKTNKIDPRRRRKTDDINATFSAIHAASLGDIEELRRQISFGHDLDRADYDGRTPLHLAAAEGHAETVRFLVRKGVELKPRDRWGATPLDDAVRHKHSDVATLLRKTVRMGSAGNAKRQQRRAS